MEFEIYSRVKAPPVAFNLRGPFIYKVIGVGGICIFLTFLLTVFSLHSYIIIGLFSVFVFAFYKYYTFAVKKSKEDLKYDTKRFCRRNLCIR